MGDVYNREKRCEVMSKIRSKDTKPEILVRKFLFSKGFRFRLHQKSLPGKSDVVLKKHNSLVLVNGCFWHGHINCKISKMPKSRIEYWHPKITNNKMKDIKNRSLLRKLGWKVHVVWECQLTNNRKDKTLNKLVKQILSQ